MSPGTVEHFWAYFGTDTGFLLFGLFLAIALGILLWIEPTDVAHTDPAEAEQWRKREVDRAIRDNHPRYRASLMNDHVGTVVSLNERKGRRYDETI